MAANRLTAMPSCETALGRWAGLVGSVGKAPGPSGPPLNAVMWTTKAPGVRSHQEWRFFFLFFFFNAISFNYSIILRKPLLFNEECSHSFRPLFSLQTCSVLVHQRLISASRFSQAHLEFAVFKQWLTRIDREIIPRCPLPLGEVTLCCPLSSSYWLWYFLG